MSEPGLGRAVLELTTDDTKFTAGLDRAKAGSETLKAHFKSAGDSAKVFGSALSSVFGEDLERRARASATGILQVGGATKLTDAEVKNHLGTLNAWIEKAARLGKEVPGHILQTRDALKQVEAAASLAAQKADALKNIEPPLTAGTKAAGLLSSAFGQFTLAGLATNAISSLTSGIGEFIKTGSKLPAVEASYGRLTASMKQDGAEMLANMNAATKGVVSNYDLMLSANKAMLLGLPITSESMGDLAQTAATLGKAMGQDATKSLDDLITALGRSSPMILDNLGLTVKVGEANEAYAAKLHKSADALSDAEKKMAFYEAAMEAAKRKTDELGAQTMTLGDIATSVWARMGDTVSREASRINNMFVGEQKIVQDWLYAFHLGSGVWADDVANMGRAIDTLFGKLGKLPAVPSLKPEVGALVPLPKLSIDELLKIGDGLDEIREKQNKAAEAAKKHADAVDALFRKYSGADARAAMRDLDTVFRRLADSGQLTEAQIAAIVAEALRLQAEGATLTDRLLAMVIATDALGPGLGTAKLNLAELGQQIAVEIPKLDAFNAALVKMAALPDGGMIPKSQRGLFGGQQLALPEIPKAPPATFWGSVFGSPADLGKQLSTTIVGAIQGGGNPVSAAAGMVGSKIGSSIAGSLTKEGGKLFNSALGGVFSAALPVIGSLLGPLTDMLWKTLFSTEGRDTKLEMAKKAFGSVEEMQRQLVTLGQAEYDRLWKQFSDVGQKNKDQAVAAVNAIVAALDAQKAKEAEVAAAAAEAAKIQQDAIDGITAKYADSFKAIDAEHKKLFESVAAEAEEAEMGVQERLDRARLEELEKERAALEQQQAAEIAAKEETFGAIEQSGADTRQYLDELFAAPLKIPYEFVGLNAPGLPVVPMDAGGYGRITSPTLFYSRGQEDFAFSGEGKRFTRPGSDAQQTIVFKLGERELKRLVIDGLPRDLEIVGVGG